MATLGILGVFAHPDDEQTVSGTMARYAAEGIRTGLVCATRGEVGEIADEALASPENLGHVRENELRAASAILGIKYLWFLGYRDSGMAGTPENGNPDNFINSDENEAVGKLVAIIREFKPTVLATFEPTGGYGHPDHIHISRLATLAFHAAADPSRYPEAGEPWATPRLFYTAFKRSTATKMRDALAREGIDPGLGDFDLSKFGLPDEEVTNSVDVSEWVPVKERSLASHRTQMPDDSFFKRLPPEVINELRATEYYSLVAGEPIPPGENSGGDLFAGLRGSPGASTVA